MARVHFIDGPFSPETGVSLEQLLAFAPAPTRSGGGGGEDDGPVYRTVTTTVENADGSMRTSSRPELVTRLVQAGDGDGRTLPEGGSAAASTSSLAAAFAAADADGSRALSLPELEVFYSSSTRRRIMSGWEGQGQQDEEAGAGPTPPPLSAEDEADADRLASDVMRAADTDRSGWVSPAELGRVGEGLVANLLRHFGGSAGHGDEL